MAATRRPGEESRALLIQAAAEIINAEGYAALSARNLAERVGLKRQIVHYYFRTMEDLLLATIRYYGDAGLARLSDAMETGNPLRAIWEIEADSSATSHAFMAMAKHLPGIRREVSLYFRKFRELQIEAVSRWFAKQHVQPGLSPAAVVAIIQSVSQGLAGEVALGNDRGHAEARAIVERWLNDVGQLQACLGAPYG